MFIFNTIIDKIVQKFVDGRIIKLNGKRTVISLIKQSFVQSYLKLHNECKQTLIFSFVEKVKFISITFQIDRR